MSNTESSPNTNPSASPPSREEMIAAKAIKDAASAWAAGEGADELVDWSDDYCLALARFAIAQLEASRWRPGTVITIDLTGQEEDAQSVYDAVENLLHDMGEIGTLSMCVSPPASEGSEGA